MLTLKSHDYQYAAGNSNSTLEPSPYRDQNHVGPQTAYGDRRLNCMYCRKVFKSHYYLKVHEKWHRGELEDRCNVCGRAFRFPSELRKHITIHSGELPYKCELCGKCFRRGQLLKIHMQVEHNASMDSGQLRGAVKEISQPNIESNWEKDLLMHISPNIETNWERELLRSSSSKIETSWKSDLLRNNSTKNETSWERDLFRNISPSEIMAREDLMQNDGSALEAGNNALAKANRQDITNAFSQLTKDFGISISFPDPVNGSGSYAGESILGLNEEFIDIKSLNLDQTTLEGYDSVTDSAMDDWKDEASIPPGWKINSEGQFMSPSGQTFGSRRAVKEFLVTNKTTDIEMQLDECGEGPGGRRHEASEERCEKCLLIKEYERKIALLQHEH